MRWWLAVIAMAGAAASARELTVTFGEPIRATVDGRAARLNVGSGRLDRLTLDADYVAAHGIRPTPLFGRADLEVGGRREFEGRHRMVTLVIEGVTRRTRAFWFAGAPSRGVDGSIGPWGLPQDRVTFAIGPTRTGETVLALKLGGRDSDSSYAVVALDGQGVALSFDIEDGGTTPIATAAAGALIAKSYGGALEGASWDIDVLMGVRRPVRLLRLAKPMTIGPLAFDRVAVRVRDRIDASGRGGFIPEAGDSTDPDEVVVTGKARGPSPNYVLTIPRAAMANCSRLTFDKRLMRVELACRKE